MLRRAHVTVSGGKVVTTKGDDGREVPLLDDGPTIAAAQALVRVQESRRLLGLDAPARVDARVLSIDELDMQIKELETLLGEIAEREGVDLYPRKHQKAGELIDELAARHGVDTSERAAVHDKVLAFWNDWKNNQRAVRNVHEFVAASLDLTVMILALPADEEEALASEVEQFLLERSR